MPFSFIEELGLFVALCAALHFSGSSLEFIARRVAAMQARRTGSAPATTISEISPEPATV